MAIIGNTTPLKGVTPRMLGLSLHGWENVMVAALVLAAVFAVAVGISTYCVVQLQRQEIATSRDEFERYKVEAAKEVGAARSDADTKIGVAREEARAAVETAQADIATANARIAEADARAKEADLKLEQLRERMRQRHLKGESFLKILEGKPKAPVEILFVRDDGEAFQLSLEIRDWLKQASWHVEEPRPLVESDLAPRLAQTVPPTMAAGGQPQGVSVFLRATSQADFERESEKNPLDPNEPIDTPRKALYRALLDSLGTISGGMSGENGRPGVLRVIVGPKPHLN